MSCTSPSVWFPKSQRAASPFSTFQNWCNVSVGFCFLDKKMCQSNVRFLRVRKHSMLFCTKIRSSISRMLMFGNLSINIFLPVFPIDMYNRPTNFLFAGTSSKFPIISQLFSGFAHRLLATTLSLRLNAWLEQQPRPSRNLAVFLRPARNS